VYSPFLLTKRTWYNSIKMPNSHAQRTAAHKEADRRGWFRNVSWARQKPHFHYRYRPRRHYRPKASRPRRMPDILAPIIFFGVPLIIIGAIVTSFMGVQPLASIKDKVVAAITDPFVVDEEEAQVIENEVFLSINQIRQENGLPLCQRDNFMDVLAREHCVYMENIGNCNHDGFEARANQIISKSGASYVGENVAGKYYDAPGLVSGWLASPRHRETIMDPTFTRTGVGYVGGYACQIFSD